MSDGPLFLPVTADDIEVLAVGVELRGRRERYPHSALLYRDDANDLKVLELFLSGDVSTESEKRAKDFAWAVPQWAADHLENIAAFCRTISARNPRLRYAFRFLSDSVLADTGTSIEIGGTSVGLTCATFVLAVFQSIGLKLVALDSWPALDEDQEWQQNWMKTILRNPNEYGGYGLSADLLARANNEVVEGCLRYRPQEVVAACRAGGHPTDYSLAGPKGKEVWSCLNTLWDMRKSRGKLPPK